MVRTTTFRRTVILSVSALAVVGLAVTGAAAATASANTQTSALAKVQVKFTMDFKQNDEAANPRKDSLFAGSGSVTDTTGAIGKVYDICAKEDVTADQTTAFCTATIKFDNGDQLSFDGVVPIPTTQPFKGMVTGGTGKYKGVFGAFTANTDSDPKNATYDVTGNLSVVPEAQ